jgi:hypothetical protein
VVAHAIIPVPWEAEKQGLQFEASWGKKLERTYFKEKKKEQTLATHVMWEAEVEVQGNSNNRQKERDPFEK